MSVLKIFGVVAAVLLIILTGTLLLPRDIAIEREEIDAELLSKGLADGGTVLKKYHKRIGTAEQSLLEGYIARAKGDMPASNEALNRAVSESGEKVDHQTIQEIHLNRMLNAYLVNDSQQLSLTVSQGRKHFFDREKWLNLFKGIEALQRGNLPLAAASVHSPGEREALSPLMAAVFSQYFSKDWEDIFLARCDIALGNQDEARDRLRALPPDASEEWDLLMGMAYIKDAAEKSPQMARADLTMAFGYLKKVDFSKEKFADEREEIAGHLTAKAENVFRDRSFDELPYYFALFEDLGVEGKKEELQERLVALVRRESAHGNRESVKKLADALSSIPQGELRRTVGRHTGEVFEKAVLRGDGEELERTWILMASLEDQLPEVRDHFRRQVVEKVFQIVKVDNGELEKTRAYLRFLDAFETSCSSRMELADRLFLYGRNLWRDKASRQKGLFFLKILKESDLPVSSVRLSDEFRSAYVSASRSDDFARLEAVASAARELDLADLDFQNAAGRENQLEDAAFLYKQGRYLEARNKARWVLNQEPQSEKAKQILGMTAYQQGEYHSAYSYLKQVPVATAELKKMLAVASFLNGDEERGNQHLEALKEEGAFNESIYLETGFGALIQENPLTALEWLKKGEKFDPKAVQAGRAFAAFEMDSWKETLRLYRELPGPYDELDGFQGIAIESLISLGEASRAGQLVENLLRKPPEPALTDYPEFFRSFKANKLDQWNRNYIAGLYFKAVEKDPARALSYFNRIENPSSYTEIMKAEIYLDGGNLYEARVVLKNVLRKAQGSEKEREVELRVLPHLAEIMTRLGYYPEGILIYRDYFSLDPEDDFFRIPYAESLMKVRRYDLALEQFEAFKSGQAFTHGNRLDYIESLIKTDRFDEANKNARDWLANRNVPIYYQIKLARFLIITGYKALLDAIFVRISEQESRSIQETRQLILLWMDMGDYDRALSLAGIKQRELESTVEGLLVLAELYTRVSREEEAFQYAELAYQLAPADARVAEIMEKYERSPAAVARATKLLKDRLEGDPDSITLQIDYAKNLIDLAIETYLSGGFEEFSQSNDLRIAVGILEELTNSSDQLKLPEAFLLLGKGYYLLDRNREAERYYKLALELDISYVDAYQLLAVVYEEKEELDQALAQVRSAAKFDPASSEVWSQLGSLLAGRNETGEAIKAFSKAVKFAPNAAGAYIRLGEVYLEKGSPQVAIDNLERALELSPKNIEAVKLILLALYDENYVEGISDKELLERRQIRFFDKLQALDPAEAREMRERLGVPYE